MQAPPVTYAGFVGGSSGCASSAIARPQLCVAAPHFGSSTRVVISPDLGRAIAVAPYVHGDAPAYAPIATCWGSPTSTTPIVSNAPASLPSTPNTSNRGVLPRSTGAVTSAGLSLQPIVRRINGATAGRPPAPCGHISPSKTWRPLPPLVLGFTNPRVTPPGSAAGPEGTFTVGPHAFTAEISTNQATRGSGPRSVNAEYPAIDVTIARQIACPPIMDARELTDFDGMPIVRRTFAMLPKTSTFPCVI